MGAKVSSAIAPSSGSAVPGAGTDSDGYGMPTLCPALAKHLTGPDFRAEVMISIVPFYR